MSHETAKVQTCSLCGIASTERKVEFSGGVICKRCSLLVVSIFMYDGGEAATTSFNHVQETLSLARRAVETDAWWVKKIEGLGLLLSEPPTDYAHLENCILQAPIGKMLNSRGEIVDDPTSRAVEAEKQTKEMRSSVGVLTEHHRKTVKQLEASESRVRELEQQVQDERTTRTLAVNAARSNGYSQAQEIAVLKTRVRRLEEALRKIANEYGGHSGVLTDIVRTALERKENV